MTIIDWIIICVVVSICSAFIGWAITYVVMNAAKQQKCSHNFTEVLHVNAPGVHKAAYLCKDCGKVKKVSL